MREKIRSRAYIMTVHAEEEMANDDLSVFDIESSLLTGEIIERQRDADTNEWKYVVRGRSLGGSFVTTITKISISRKLVFITVYANS